MTKKAYFTKIDGSGGSGADLKNIIVINPDADVAVGKTYKLAQDAIDYLNGLTTAEDPNMPAEDNVWGLLITGTNTENLTFPHWVVPIGLGVGILEGEIQVAPTPSDIIGDDMAVNGDFDDWSGDPERPDDWTFTPFEEGADITKEQVITYDGNTNSVRFDFSAGIGTLSQVYEVEEGKTYRLRTFDYGDGRRATLFTDGALFTNIYTPIFGWIPSNFFGGAITAVNEDFSDWTDIGGGDYTLDNFTVVGDLTVEREEVEVYEGTYSAKLTIPASTHLLEFPAITEYDDESPIVIGDAFEIKIYTKGTEGNTGSLFVIMANDSYDSYTKLFDFEEEVWIDWTPLQGNPPEDCIKELDNGSFNYSTNYLRLYAEQNLKIVPLAYGEEVADVYYIGKWEISAEGNVNRALFESENLFTNTFGVNTLINGDFETWAGEPEEATGWATINATLTKESVIVPEGSTYAGKFSGTGADDYIATAPLDESYTEGDVVRLKFDVAEDSESTVYSLGYGFINNESGVADKIWNFSESEWEAWDGTTIDYSNLRYITNLITSYQTIESEYFVPIDASDKIQAIFLMPTAGASTHTVYLDNVELNEVTREYDWVENITDQSIPAPESGEIGVGIFASETILEEGESPDLDVYNYLGKAEFFEYTDVPDNIMSRYARDITFKNLKLGTGQLLITKNCNFTGCVPDGGTIIAEGGWVDGCDFSNLGEYEHKNHGFIGNNFTGLKVPNLSGDNSSFAGGMYFNNCDFLENDFIKSIFGGGCYFNKCLVANAEFLGNASFYNTEFHGVVEPIFADDSTYYMYFTRCKNFNLTRGHFELINCTSTDEIYLGGDALLNRRNCTGCEVIVDEGSEAIFNSYGSAFDKTGTVFTGEDVETNLKELGAPDRSLNPADVTSSPYIADSSNRLLHILYTGTAAVAVSLATANFPEGVVYYFKDASLNADNNNITITPSTGTIEGEANYIIDTKGGCVGIYRIGSNWFMLTERP